MRKILILLFLLNLSVALRAQDFYVSANISKTISVSENMKPIGVFEGYPGVNFSVGNNFNRYWGIRATAGINPQSGYAGYGQMDVMPDIFTRYDFLTLSGYVDCMINLAEIFMKPDYYRTDALYLVIGGGAIRTGKFSSKVHGPEWKKYYPVKTYGLLFGVAHLGLAGSVKLTRSLDLGIEAKYNFVSDKYNGVKHGSSLDGFVDIGVGINWFFSRRHLQRSELPRLPYEIMEQKQEEVFVENQRMKTGISFYFDFSDLNAKQWEYVENVADFLKDNPAVRLVVHSYADKNYTDDYNLSHNKSLATQRAQSVIDRLVNVHNIAANRLSVNAHTEALNDYKQEGEWIRAVEFEMTK